MSIRILAALALAAGLGLTALAAYEKVEAKEFASKDGKFKATFPGPVKTTETKAGGTALHTATAQPKPEVVYQVVYFDIPFEVPADKAQETLKQFASALKGMTLSEKDVKLGKEKLPAREAVYELTGAHLRQLMVLDGKRVYQVSVGGPKKEDVTSKAADQFVGSFRVTK